MMTAPAAAGAAITISDLLDANPIVTTSPDLINVDISISFERAAISGLVPAGATLQPGTRSVILIEPSGDPFGPPQSDFLTLTIGATAPTFSIVFESDGAANYASHVAALPAGTPTLIENGTFQELSTALNSGVFSIQVQSDLASSEVPEPSSWLLLVSGLMLGWAGFAWRRAARRPRER